MRHPFCDCVGRGFRVAPSFSTRHVIAPFLSDTTSWDAHAWWAQRVTLLCEEQHADDTQPSSNILPGLIDIGIELLREMGFHAYDCTGPGQFCNVSGPWVVSLWKIRVLLAPSDDAVLYCGMM